ncbi:MAG: hypothetical protein CM15mP12_2670 [Gammaproteobacteria bacterium]|nr:MAG: hypothetical protein CM15mP12_2670 [Gammaproteobacteria bacterium]
MIWFRVLVKPNVLKIWEKMGTDIGFKSDGLVPIEGFKIMQKNKNKEGMKFKYF